MKKRNLENLAIYIGVPGLVWGAIIYSVLNAKEYQIAEFNYLGKTAKVIKVEAKMLPDTYFVRLKNGNDLEGTFITDQLDTIEVSKQNFSINGVKQK